ncbi:MAG: hypothetical protein EA411_01000 [Saprospirales bacterium]|nr:MAG: hypothetical protein EA411_01000 [Saprospirales bacterium]
MIAQRHFSFLTLALFILLVTGCTRVQHLATVSSANQTVEEATHPEKDSAVLALIEPYRIEMEAQMSEVIGITETALPLQQPDGPMNRLVADIMLDLAEEESGGKVHFAIQNFGGLRINSLPEGEITLGTMYELMPFENYLVILEISGKTVAQFCDLIAANGGWPVSRGLNFSISDSHATDIAIDGSALDMQATYTIATNDYLADGGDNCYFLTEYEQNNTGVLIRDAFIQHFQRESERGHTLSDPGDGPRINYVEN